MAERQQDTSQALNYAIVIAVLLLVGLFVYGNHYRSQLEKINAPEAPPVAAAPAPVSENEGSVGGPSVEDAIHPPTQVPLSIADHPDPSPPGTTGTLDDPKEMRRVIANQSRQLRAETAAQGFRPEDRRALALTEEEIRELEKSGNIIQ